MMMVMLLGFSNEFTVIDVFVENLWIPGNTAGRYTIRENSSHEPQNLKTAEFNSNPNKEPAYSVQLQRSTQTIAMLSTLVRGLFLDHMVDFLLPLREQPLNAVFAAPTTGILFQEGNRISTIAPPSRVITPLSSSS